MTGPCVTALVAALFCVGLVSGGNPDAKRLYDDLLSNYNKLVRPVVNVSEAVTVRLKLKLSQLIDVVSSDSSTGWGRWSWTWVWLTEVCGAPPAGRPLLRLPTAQVGWWDIPIPCQPKPGPRPHDSPCN